MVKRGPKPRRLVNTNWSGDLTYAVGLLATDGCLGGDGLWVDLTSKDREQLLNFNKCIGLDLKIGKKNLGYKNEAWRIQIKNKIFYEFLLSVGLTSRKSRKISKLEIPNKYFFDFLRGCFDGDGSFYSYWDPRWKSSFVFYISFVSASESFISWIRNEIGERLGIRGHLGGPTKNNVCYQLKYAKKDSVKIIEKMYQDKDSVYLKRKKLKIDKALATMGGLV